ncbi:NAD-dependent DNA ligase LigA [Halostella litorea]|uniref:NAD-dependent DNA ligase LigA n=1 Tax=Halostella litorea TaxID=2528831 RepID=UPI00109302EF|nr:NAD-dependent DNA ligase LigA [Halostella litorea]
MASPETDDNPYLRDPPTEFDPVSDLPAAAAREQAELLREAVRYHDRRYYVEHDPVVADRTYDALFARLEALEDAFDLETEDSPTRRVGGEPVDEFDTVEHVAPMLSIDQSGDAADVREFDERVRGEVGDVTYVCEPKFDGVSIEVVYEDGRLVRAATRGDGYEGDDVTRNVRTIRAIPQRLARDPPDFLAVRGEVYMPRDAFQAHNRERVERGEEPFANPRNATAGTLRQQDPAVVAERPLACYFFEVLDSSDEWPTRWAEHGALPGFGLPVAERVEHAETIDAAIDYRDRLHDERDALDYEIDGAVIKVDDRGTREELGATARHYRWAFAYKFPARAERTTVRDVAVQVGRTGRLTPVALLDPVDVGGVTVSRASLHNPDEIAEMGVAVGDEVRVERAGDVIPYVAEVTEKRSEGHYEFPETCPVCDSPVERDGPMAFCTGGMACPAQLRRAVEYYASDDGLDVEGLGERSVRQFVEAGLVEDSVADLYAIEREDLLDLEGWGEKSAEKLLAELADSTEPDLPDFLSALGVPGVGPATARELARKFGTLDAVVEADEDDLQDVPDVGPTVAAQVRDFFDSEANRRALDALREHGVEPRPYESEGGDELAGLTFVFTGSLDGYTRSEAQALVERHGGSATGSVSGNTDYLVAGENPGATKVTDAESEDVPVLDEAAFEDLLDERGV